MHDCHCSGNVCAFFCLIRYNILNSGFQLFFFFSICLPQIVNNKLLVDWFPNNFLTCDQYALEHIYCYACFGTFNFALGKGRLDLNKHFEVGIQS